MYVCIYREKEGLSSRCVNVARVYKYYVPLRATQNNLRNNSSFPATTQQFFGVNFSLTSYIVLRFDLYTHIQVHNIQPASVHTTLHLFCLCAIYLATKNIRAL